MFFKPAPPHSKPENKKELEGAIFLRKLRITLFLMFFLWLPFGALVMSVFPSEKISITFIIIYLCAVVVVIFWYSFSKCPRCNNFYTWKFLYSNGFTSKCLHCGLSILKKDLTVTTK